MDIHTIQSVYFIGAGGIGMSALIRYFLSRGKQVAGYDRTPSELTSRLIAEGARIHYEDDATLIPDDCRNRETTLVVYTPAVPQTHTELLGLPPDQGPGLLRIFPILRGHRRGAPACIGGGRGLFDRIAGRVPQWGAGA